LCIEYRSAALATDLASPKKLGILTLNAVKGKDPLVAFIFVVVFLSVIPAGNLLLSGRHLQI
jgi:hypothetical protein